MSLIQVEDLTVRYGASTALSGAVKPVKGRVVQESGVKIGYVPQNLHIDETLPITVSRFLKLPSNVEAADISYALTRAGVPRLGQSATFTAFRWSVPAGSSCPRNNWKP